MKLNSRIEGSGQPLLIIHGFLGSSDNWKTFAGQYAEEGYEVHAIDMRNHGKSGHSDESNYKVMVDDVLEYCSDHQLASVDVIGHSMGGKIAMLLATRNPDLVQKLIIADIGPKYYRQHHQDILAGLNSIDFSQKPSRSQVEEQLKTYVDDAGTVQFLAKNLYWKEPGQLDFRFNLPVLTKEIENIGEALPENVIFDKPTLFLRGANSNYIKDEDIDDIKKQFPKAIIVTLKDAGHWLHAEQPAAFLQSTLLFLKQ
ncbi:alpha/beta fold hydrolase [Flavobacterium silvaticum]|uniref:Alpha/beta fold hydrolase n=1 Tax=Flavobacterium silvaticum TaxID=1852020 RepID=A0A972JH10_9FLAO|nr:alpha/beta fold hydrolase [Flavobacterium silvaticum]NMH27450.1 alpha/beta fold hydrolase [Flavobacterium silvaticum]